MAPKTEIQNDDDAPVTPVRRKRSRAWRWGLWSILGAGALAAAMAVLIVLMVGKPLRAPDWLRDRIEMRIADRLPNLHLTFRDLHVVVNEGWRPRLRLRDVAVSRADGPMIVQLTDVHASLAMRPLLRGKIQVRDIALFGANATLQRDVSGNVALSLGPNAAPVESAAGVPQLIEEWSQILTTPQLSTLRSIQMDSLTLRYENARQGRAWTLDGGRVQLDRTGNDLRVASSFALLSGGDSAGLVEMNYSSRIGTTQAEFGVSIQDIAAQDIAAQGVAFSWLDPLRAPISGALRGSVDSAGALGPLSATLQIGAGVLQPTEQTRPIPFSGARSYFTYSPGEQVLVFDELSVSSDWGAGVAEGRAYLGGASAGKLTDLIGQFTLTDLSVNPDGLYDEPLLLDEISTDFQLELDPFRFKMGQMRITDPLSEAQLSGELAATSDGWDLSVDAMMNSLTPERLVALWPEGAAPKPRKWVDTNLTGGTLSNLTLALRVKPQQKPQIYVNFDYDDATIKFLKNLPPITGATGQASLNGTRFVATAIEGRVVADEGGAVDVGGTSFIIPDIGIKKAAPGVVRLNGTGSVTSVMSLLNRPPLEVLKGTPFPVDLAQGLARLSGTVALPLKDKAAFDEIEFHINGEIEDVESNLLVPDQVVTSERLSVKGDQTQIILAGSGKLGPVPVTVQWRQPLGAGVGKASRLQGQVELSQQLVDTLDIGLPPGTVSGKGTGEFTLDFAPQESPQLAMNSDLRGVGLRLPALGWSKPASSTGVLNLTGSLGDQARLDRLVLQAAGLSATGTVLNRVEGGLERALFSSVRLGGWLDARVEIIGRGEQPPDMRILGGTMDMRTADFGSSDSGGSGGATGRLQVALDRLQVTDTIALTGFTGDFRTTGGLDGNFRGQVNGQTNVSGQVVPQAGRSAVRIQSRDAGGVFRAAGVLEQAREGTFDLSLLPADQPGQFDGTLRVTGTKVQNAPVIAALLNSISLIGLFDELSGQGIQFAEVDAKFRLGPSRLTLFSSSATGPSIGISMDGTFDVPTSRLNMRGVISPVYLLNSVGSVLTRKGEGLIGFNYTLRGTSDAPEVVVNPLSALTPGMFRDILRSAPPPIDENLPVKPRQPSRRPDILDGSKGGR